MQADAPPSTGFATSVIHGCRVSLGYDLEPRPEFMHRWVRSHYSPKIWDHMDEISILLANSFSSKSVIFLNIPLWGSIPYPICPWKSSSVNTMSTPVTRFTVRAYLINVNT